MYLFQPGSQLYIEAANSFLSDQLLFGSSYTFRPIRQSIEDFLAFGLPDAVNEKVLYANAKRVLNTQ
jgi:predicted TIM-barrel fold metal-dependent hydrolase